MIKGLLKEAEASFAMLPGFQPERRKEAVRHALMEDLFKIKLFGGVVVALAAVVYLLTSSANWYMATGLAGVAALHVAAFAWAKPYLRSSKYSKPTAARATARRPARKAQAPLYDPVFAD